MAICRSKSLLTVHSVHLSTLFHLVLNHRVICVLRWIQVLYTGSYWIFYQRKLYFYNYCYHFIAQHYVTTLQGLLHPKMKICLCFTHHRGILGVFDFLLSDESDQSYIEKVKETSHCVEFWETALFIGPPYWGDRVVSPVLSSEQYLDFLLWSWKMSPLFVIHAASRIAKVTRSLFWEKTVQSGMFFSFSLRINPKGSRSRRWREHSKDRPWIVNLFNNATD